MAKNTLKFTPGNEKKRDPAEVGFEKNEKVPLCIGLLVDRTASRETTIEFFTAAFKAQAKQLGEDIAKVTSVESLQIVLGTYTQARVDDDRIPLEERGIEIQIDDPITLDELSDALDRIECQTGYTQITRSLVELKNRGHKLNGVIVVGDTADGDNEKDLKAIGRSFGVPIITLFDKTGGTQPSDIEKMRVLSQASGVTGCPANVHDTEFAFSEQALEIILASAGPEVLKEAREKGVVKTNTGRDRLLDRIASPLSGWKRDFLEMKDNVMDALKSVSPKKWLLGLGLPALLITAVSAPFLFFNREKEKVPEHTNVTPAPVAQPAPKVINLPSLFKGGSAELDTSDTEVVRTFVEQVRNMDCADVRRVIEGHASADGSETSNMRLSLKRAAGVELILGRDGVKNTLVVGRGEKDAQQNPPDKADRKVVIKCAEELGL